MESETTPTNTARLETSAPEIFPTQTSIRFELTLETTISKRKRST